MNEALLNYFKAGKEAGCARDQLLSFWKYGYIAQPKQLEFHAAARLCDLPDGPTKILLGGSRGPGKSHSILAQIGLDDMDRYSNLEFLYLRETSIAASEAMEKLLRNVFVNREYEFIPSKNKVLLPNDNVIRIAGFKNARDINKYQGNEYDGMGIEEGTQIPYERLDMLHGSLRSTREDWRCRTYYSCNPGGVSHGQFKKNFVIPYRAKTEKDTRFIPSTYKDNKFLRPEYITWIEGLKGWLASAWRDGDWDVFAGQYFVNWRYDKHVVDISSIPGGDNARVWLSFDYGYNHYSVFQLHALYDGIVYTLDEYRQRRTLVVDHVNNVNEMLAYWGLSITDMDALPAGKDIFAKKHDGNTIADEYATHGYYFTMANDDRVNGWAAMTQRLGDDNKEPTWFVNKRCVGLIETLPTLVYSETKPEDVKKVDVDADGDGGDDSPDCARYGIMEVPRLGGVIVEDNFLFS